MKTNHPDITYLTQMEKILKEGAIKTDRTGTGTRSLFGIQMRFNLAYSFPLLTTKKLHLKSIIYELLWFLNGDTNIKYLNDNGVHIWDEWADSNGNLGPIYGHQWRSWPNIVKKKDACVGDSSTHENTPIDQITNLISQIKKSPDSRRLIVCAWNVADIDKMAIPPCHCLFQFYIADGKLSCQLYQRSADFFLGVPFNIASYSLLTMMIAQVCGLKLGEFIWIGGDTHLYLNHLDQARLQISRKKEVRPLPVIKINPEVTDIFGFKYQDFTLENYDPHPMIKAPIAV